ncbi:exonuclease VII small subunit [Arthrobacter sp. V4I6]|nr:exonuclease VII small subunit [Arthrobacter sp. V4I6]
MNSELERLRALAAVIATAEAALDTAYRTLQASAAALLRTGDATLAEARAGGQNQIEASGEEVSGPVLAGSGCFQPAQSWGRVVGRPRK